MALSSLASAFAGGGGGGVVGTAIVNMVGNNAQLVRDFDAAKAETSAAANEMGAASSTGSLAVQAAWVAAGAAVLKFGVDSVKAFQEHQQVAAQTEAVLKSTGGQAGVTAGQVEQLATQIRDYSGADDEAVQASENFLLTFRNVQNEAGRGNDIFTQSTKAIVDMATAVNEGAVPTMEQLHSTTLQLGKALNDPIAGMTALKRVGVSFTSSQVQTIKALQTSGHLLEAQKLILGEVEKEFGGAARAAGSTFAGQLSILESKFRDIEESVGAALVPTLSQVTKMLTTLAPIIQPLVTGAFDLLAQSISGVVEQAGSFAQAAQTVITTAQSLTDKTHTSATGFLDLGSIVHDAFSQMVADAEGPVKVVVDQINAIKASTESAAGPVFHLGVNIQGAADQVINLAHAAAAAPAVFDHLKGSIGSLSTLLGTDTQTFIDNARVALQTGEDAWQKFRDSTVANATKAAAEWRQSTAQSLNFVDDALQNLSGSSHVTADKIAKDFTQSARTMHTFGNDIQTILKRGGDNAKSLAQNLVSMGADGAKAAHAIASANQKDFNQIIGTWHKAEGDSASLANKLQGEIVGTLNDIRDILAAIARTWHINVDANTGPAEAGIARVQSQLHALDGQTATVTVVTQTQSYKRPPGGGPGGAEGAITRLAGGGFMTDGPMMIHPNFMAGEGAYPTGHGRGMEWVQPLDYRGQGMMTRMLADAMSRAGAGGASGPTVIIQGDVYGMDDFERKVLDGLNSAIARRRRG